MTYYLDPVITGPGDANCQTAGTQCSQVIQAFDLWNQASVNNGSNVVFTRTTNCCGDYQLYNSDGAAGCQFGGVTDWPSSGSARTVFYTTPNCITVGFDPNVPGADTYWLKVALHEIGHTFGLDDIPVPANICDQPDGVTVMNAPCGINDGGGNMPTNPSSFCDLSTLQVIYPAPQPPGGGGGCNQRISPHRCIRGQDCCPSPIVIDVDGNGYDLTGSGDGVVFDIDASGHPERVAWTSTGSDDAWLVLDRNGNGVIDDATEMFGDHTAQPPSNHKNGFLALAVFDEPLHGGNGDGWISAEDEIYSKLQLWVDSDHNGASEPNELHTLRELGVAGIGLEFQDSRRVDEHGNAFGYRARIRRARGAHDGRWAYDVFLMAGSASAD